jgi:peptidoglycan/xylan/chitin deacetylase (PgdA/CDA1 family)
MRGTQTIATVYVALTFNLIALLDYSAQAHAASWSEVRVAITVDDLPGYGAPKANVIGRGSSHAIMDALKKNGAPAYGFSIGTQRTPEGDEILRHWVAAGYRLGNHTFNHPHLNAVTAEAFVASIERQDVSLENILGDSESIDTRRMFRYPYLDEGDTLEKRNDVRAYLAQKGYRVAQVTTNYDDWAWTSAYVRCLEREDTASIDWLKRHVADSANRHLLDSRALARRLFHRDIPQILLLHTGAFTALSLDSILKNWRAQGVKFIPLEQALADPAYGINPNIPDECAACTGDHGRPFLEQIALARGVEMKLLKDVTYTADRMGKVCRASSKL